MPVDIFRTDHIYFKFNTNSTDNGESLVGELQLQIKSLGFSLALFPIILSCSNDRNENLDQNIIHDLSRLESEGQARLVGGLPIQSPNFDSSGVFYNVSTGQTCSLTRIGIDLFLTAGHCVSGIDTPIALESHDRTTIRNFTTEYGAYHYNLFAPSTYSFEFDAIRKTSTITLESLERRPDWAVMRLDVGSDPDSILDNLAYIGDNYKIRKIGDSEKVKVGNTVLVGGFGDNKEDDGIIFNCDEFSDDCDLQYDTSTVGKPGRYAFFKIQSRGNTAVYNPFYSEKFLFAGKSTLQKVENGNQSNYEVNYNVDPASKDPRGLVAPGDSGAAVLNGANQVIGVVKGYAIEYSNPPVYWNVFSAFDYTIAKSKIDQPWLYFVPEYVAETSKFFVLGKNLNKLRWVKDGVENDSVYAMKKDPDCSSMTATQKNFVAKGGLIRGKEYECYIAPKYAYRENRFDLEQRLGGPAGLGPNQSIIVLPKNSFCSTPITWYSSDNGTLSIFGVDNEMELVGGNSMDEAKANSIARATAIGKAKISRLDTPKKSFDYLVPETCTGTKGDAISSLVQNAESLARQIADAAQYEEGSDSMICQGGTVHYIIQYARYKLGTTICQ